MSGDIKETVRSYIIKKANLDKLDDRDEIIAKNYLDSMGFIMMGAWMEEEFKIKINNEDFTEENFRNLESITRLVESKRKR